jgi:hypothetical protein
MDNQIYSVGELGRAFDELRKTKWGVDFSKYKAVISGPVKEVYEFEKDIHFGGQLKSRNRRKKRVGKRNLGIRRPFSISRARKHIRRLIACNSGQYPEYTDKFITFTFADNVTGLKEANEMWRKFMMRLNYHIGHALKYVSVVEFQKRGAVHYHAVFFNLPYIVNDELAEIWSHGFIKINAIQHIQSIGAYVSKYLQKGVVYARLFNEKCYFTSRGLKKPITIRTPPLDIEFIDSEKIEYQLEASCTLPYNQWTGHTTYKRYRVINY